MRVHKFAEYNLQYDITYDFLNSFNLVINESTQKSYKKVAKKVISDLRLNSKLILTFGTSIGVFFPVVEKLMKNMNIDAFNLDIQSVVLLTIAAITIIYLEEKKFQSAEEEQILTKDSKSMLEELKLKGFGNNVVKKLIKGLKSIKNIFYIIGKHANAVISSFVDMFAYTAILIPIMNGINYIIGKYNLNLDTIIQNFSILSTGVATIIAKNGIIEILNKIKNRVKVNTKEVVDEIEVPVIQKYGTFGDADTVQSGELIKEQ